MWFVEYWICGDPLVKTRCVEDENHVMTPGDVLELLVLGRDVFKVNVTWVQDTLEANFET